MARPTVWIIESKPKNRKTGWVNAGPYKFKRKSDFGTLASIKKNGSPNRDYRFRKIKGTATVFK